MWWPSRRRASTFSQVTTATCQVAALGSAPDRLYGVQFHPEVAHTPCGKTILPTSSSAYAVAMKIGTRCHRVPIEARHSRTRGPSATSSSSSAVEWIPVWRSLLATSRARSRPRSAAYVDTGLMREGETDPGAWKPSALKPFSSKTQFFSGRSRAASPIPKQKRHIIGEEFVEVQERASSQRRTCLDRAGFWARAPSTPTRSNSEARQGRCH